MWIMNYRGDTGQWPKGVLPIAVRNTARKPRGGWKTPPMWIRVNTF